VNLAAPGGIEARLFGRNLILVEKDVSKDEGGRMKDESADSQWSTQEVLLRRSSAL
jgi:hypothetical protein